MKTNILLALSGLVFIIVLAWFFVLRPEQQPLGVGHCILKNEEIVATLYTEKEVEDFANHCMQLKQMEQ